MTITESRKNTTFEDVYNAVMKDSEGKADYTTPIKNLTMLENGKFAFLDTTQVRGPKLRDIAFESTDWGTGQMLSRLNMPAAYFKRAHAEDPELFRQHFNYWAGRDDRTTMLRTKVVQNTITGQDLGLIRGAVSESYSTMDNDTVMNILRQIFNRSGEDRYNVESFHLDDHRFHLRLSYLDLTRATGTLPDGTPDYNRVGNDIINSEVAASAFHLQDLLWRLICANGLKSFAKEGDPFSQRHVHLRPDEFKARVASEMIKSVKQGVEFLEEFQKAQDQKIPDPFVAIRNIAKSEKFSEELSDQITSNFEGDKSAYGVVNAITRAARYLPNERRLQVERVAGKVVRFTPTQWERLTAIETPAEGVA